MNIQRVSDTLGRLKAPAFRLEQLRRAVFRETSASYEEISVLPVSLRQALGQAGPLLSVSAQAVLVSGTQRAHKASLKLCDGQEVETVLLRPSPTRWTTCISCQVGCAIGCTFCATGLMGFSRHLTPEEITDQVLFWRQYMKQRGLEGRLDNVVYMGMGEPFACYDNVSESLKILMDQRQFAVGARHISVSTSGLVPQIERFGKDFPQVNLAVSLHAADDELRDRLVPINRAYPLARLGKALRTYLRSSSRKVFLEYVLLRGENDRPEDAERLIQYVKSLGPLELLHVNLILFNQTETRHGACSEESARVFHKRLRNADIRATVRQNLGRDIQGACGQLIAQAKH
ncbi:MAG: hypothetical protein A3J74_01395 [Elusimicrobia bacterium RIFCSPHIGHO2_02_FULL_57_9]|nr:MAG: hypothetical protein A3J74_01395 [Elusimicrobia bacterium RIFCSPHIGHO2_02_FULL_57_9]